MFEIASDWERDVQSAHTAVWARAQETVRKWLETEFPAETDLAAPHHLTRLLSRSDISWRESQQRRERPYGTVSRVAVQFRLTAPIIDDWANELRAADRQRTAVLWIRLAATAIGFALLTMVVRGADRWTRGYRRMPLGMVWLVGAMALTAAIWL